MEWKPGPSLTAEDSPPRTSPAAQERPERAQGTVRFEVPRRLRTAVRARESGLVVVAALIGVIAGLGVTAMSRSVELLHRIFFMLAPGERLSSQDAIPLAAALLVPTIGGFLFGYGKLAVSKRSHGRTVDPIEANALHGGRMSWRGSVIVALETVWSSGVGASVGLEAGYTQLAAGMASFIGQAFRLRRGDLRLLVGCGAAGGIAGAFGAPFAGAFYGFELVLGSYSIASLAPVGTAALIGYLVTEALASGPLGVSIETTQIIAGRDLAMAGVLGLCAGLFGIVLMRGVALSEKIFTTISAWPPLRGALGGLLVGIMGFVSPHVMSSGHGALHFGAALERPVQAVALVFALKAAASIVSLGAGFRGGLFFSSLLMGALGGHVFAQLLSGLWPGFALDPNVFAVVGMGALSVAVIGGPLTMTFVVLESTGDLWLTATVLVAVIASAQFTRELFGYSFATWRFHLRGETIRSAADVGWIRDLTVATMMRRDVPTVPVDTPVWAFREDVRLGSTGQVIAVESDGRYAGVVITAEAHGPGIAPDESIRSILRYKKDVLLPDMTIKEAVTIFDRTEADALAVVDTLSRRKIVGLLSESHALRRYAEELELRRRDLLGEEVTS